MSESPRSESLRALAEHISAALPGAVSDPHIAYDELTLTAERNEILRVLMFLRDDPQCAFRILIDICGVDYPNRASRFDVVYHFLSVEKNARLRVKVMTEEDVPVPSVIAAYPAANWFEREAFDMYGILFSDHPDLRRLLTDYGFSGFPLRKDFPLTGFAEVRYDDEQKRVVYEPVKLVQEFRNFDFFSPWEGAPYIMLPGDEKATPASADGKK